MVSFQKDSSGVGSVERENILDMDKSLHKSEHISTWKLGEVANQKNTVLAMEQYQGIQLEDKAGTRSRWALLNRFKSLHLF